MRPSGSPEANPLNPCPCAAHLVGPLEALRQLVVVHDRPHHGRHCREQVAQSPRGHGLSEGAERWGEAYGIKA